VNRLTSALGCAIAALALGGGGALAADEPATDIPLTTDLTAVIALQGLPCGKVVGATKQAENDYLATCQDGTRYRVLVNAEGRVVVSRQ